MNFEFNRLPVISEYSQSAYIFVTGTTSKGDYETSYVEISSIPLVQASDSNRGGIKTGYKRGYGDSRYPVVICADCGFVQAELTDNILSGGRYDADVSSIILSFENSRIADLSIPVYDLINVYTVNTDHMTLDPETKTIDIKEGVYESGGEFLSADDDDQERYEVVQRTGDNYGLYEHINDKLNKIAIIVDIDDDYKCCLDQTSPIIDLRDVKNPLLWTKNDSEWTSTQITSYEDIYDIIHIGQFGYNTSTQKMWYMYGEDVSCIMCLDRIRHIVFTSTDGTECMFLSDETTQTVQYVNSSGVVQSPYSLCSEIDSKDELVSVEDQIGSISSVGQNSFYSCTSLTSILLPNVNQINSFAFSGCTYLASVYIPNVKSIGQASFFNCKYLNTLSVASENLDIRLLDQNNLCSNSGIVLIDENSHEVIWGSIPLCRNVVLGNDIVSIGWGAFAGCVSLTSFSATNVQSIEYGAFFNCTSLTSVSIPNVQSIGQQAFAACTSLTSVYISKVQLIESMAFYSCKTLSSIYIDETDTVTTLENVNAFTDLPSEYEIWVKNEEMYNKFIVADTWNDISSHITYMCTVTFDANEPTS